MNGLMEEVMKVSGKITIWRDLEYINGMMEEYLLDNMRTIQKITF